MRRAGLGECLDGADGGEDGVAVVRGAPPVEAVAFAHGQERVEPPPPAAERGLLVEMPVQQCDELGLGALEGRDVDDDDRSQAVALDYLDRAARDGTRSRPVR